MNEIMITVNVDNDKPTVSGQELHEALMIDLAVFETSIVHIMSLTKSALYGIIQ